MDPGTAPEEARKDSGYAEDRSIETNAGHDTPSPTARAAPEPTKDGLQPEDAGGSTDEEGRTSLHAEISRPSLRTTSTTCSSVPKPAQRDGDDADRCGGNSERSAREVLKSAYSKVIDAFRGKKARKRRGKRKVEVRVEVQTVPPQLMVAMPIQETAESQPDAAAAGLPKDGVLEAENPKPKPAVKVKSWSERYDKRKSICSCGSLDHGCSSPNDSSQRMERPES